MASTRRPQSAYACSLRSTLPAGNPPMSWWLRTPRDLLHLGCELRGRDYAALDERLGERRHPLLVVSGAVVGFGRQRLDVLAQLVYGHEALLAALFPGDSHAQHHEGVDPPLPVVVVVLDRLDFARGQAAHVVVQPDHWVVFHATHSETGALASCSGWHTISTSVGPPCARACFSTGSSSRGSETFQLLTPNASATFA